MNRDSRVLVCRRGGLFTRTYILTAGAHEVGTIDFRDASRGDLKLEGRAYVAAKEFRGAWSLAHDDSVVARARRLHRTPLALELKFNDRAWLIQARATSPLRYEITEGGGVIGRVQAKLGLISNRLEIDAPFGGETLMLAYTAWLIGSHWVGIAGIARGASAA